MIIDGQECVAKLQRLNEIVETDVTGILIQIIRTCFSWIYYTVFTSGKIKFFANKKEGFGYVTRDDEKDDLYFSKTSAVYGKINQNEAVSFDVIKNGSLLNAINIRSIDENEPDENF